MLQAYIYNPIQFFLIAYLGSWIPGFIAIYLKEKYKINIIQLSIILAIFTPLIATLFMIYNSGNQGLINNFLHRLFLFNINIDTLPVILLLMPCVVLLATAISLLFGYPKNQFSLSEEFSVMKGIGILGVIIPFVLAPILEEVGWRGYGLESLMAYFNLFTTSILFSLLWGIWHLPAFFMEGYYHNDLLKEGKIYAINFFVSLIPITILMNWVYVLNNQSIPVLILFHSVLNIFFMIFKTEQFTKCIITFLLFIVSIIVILMNKSMFFN